MPHGYSDDVPHGYRKSFSLMGIVVQKPKEGG